MKRNNAYLISGPIDGTKELCVVMILGENAWNRYTISLIVSQNLLIQLYIVIYQLNIDAYWVSQVRESLCTLGLI